MFFVYILQSEKDGSFYIGQTNKLDDRLKRHNSGYERYTKLKRPWFVIWSHSFETRSEAMRFEKRLKNFKSRKKILEFINAGPVPTSRDEDARP